jgi:hypothetical protein
MEEVMSQTNAAEVKAAIFAAKRPKFKIVEFGGHKLEIRQPTVITMLNKAIDQRTAADQLSEQENDRRNTVQAIVDMTYVPGTQDKVFSSEDIPALLEMGFDSEFSKLQTACLDLLGINPEEIDEAQGKSEPARNGTTSLQ